MNINHHLIKDTEIVGIGPLMLERTKEHAFDTLYCTRRYFFEVHLHAHTIKIESDWFDLKGHEKQQLDDYRSYAEKFKQGYHTAREKVLELIGESATEVPANENRRTNHIIEVGKCYEAIKDNLNDLLSDLAPAEHNQKPINNRVSSVFDELRLLRDLACTKPIC